MKRRRYLRMLLALTFGLAGIAGVQAFAGPKAKAPKGKVVIKSCQKKKSPVTFDHAAHVKTMKAKKWKGQCESCHHKVEGKVPKDNTCGKCHAKPQGKLGTCADMSKKKNPYHVRCISCHKAEGKGTKAPTKCKQCHPK